MALSEDIILILDSGFTKYVNTLFPGVWLHVGPNFEISLALKSPSSVSMLAYTSITLNNNKSIIIVIIAFRVIQLFIIQDTLSFGELNYTNMPAANARSMNLFVRQI